MAFDKIIDSEKLEKALTATADTIRAITGSTGAIQWNEETGFQKKLSALVPSEPTEPLVEKDVIFIDYDGTLLYSYTFQEVQALTELPELPEHNGLVCQGWNYDLETLKSYNSPVTVGAMYITDDGRTRVYITLTEGRTSPVVGLGVNGTATVDWGDGTEPDVLTGTSLTSGKYTNAHKYATAGNHVISISVEGEAALIARSIGNYTGGILVVNSSTDDVRNTYYNNAITRIELGDNMVLGKNGCQYFDNLESITIPVSMTTWGGYLFWNCGKMEGLVVPPGSILSSCTINYRGLMRISLPDDVTGGSFYSTYLTRLDIPNGLTNIPEQFLYYNSCITKVVIPEGVTSIGANAFYQCYALKEIWFQPTTPPTVEGGSVFHKIPTDCVIYVPYDSLDAYKSATNYPSPSSYSYLGYN